MTSEAQQRATNKYIREKLDDIKIRVQKGKREEYKKRVQDIGYPSLNAFIIEALEEKLEREERR